MNLLHAPIAQWTNELLFSMQKFTGSMYRIVSHFDRALGSNMLLMCVTVHGWHCRSIIRLVIKELMVNRGSNNSKRCLPRTLTTAAPAMLSVVAAGVSAAPDREAIVDTAMVPDCTLLCLRAATAHTPNQLLHACIEH
jgi:hypothetical protein